LSGRVCADHAECSGNFDILVKVPSFKVGRRLLLEGGGGFF
jgi:hypothetical protein